MSQQYLWFYQRLQSTNAFPSFFCLSTSSSMWQCPYFLLYVLFCGDFDVCLMCACCVQSDTIFNGAVQLDLSVIPLSLEGGFSPLSVEMLTAGRACVEWRCRVGPKKRCAQVHQIFTYTTLAPQHRSVVPRKKYRNWPLGAIL